MGKTAVKSENRRPYLKDIVRNENGDLVYTGDVYRISPGREISSHESGSVSSAGTRTGAEAEREAGPGRIYLQLIIRSLIPGVLSIASGCIGGAGSSHAFYVILPYIGEISALFAMYWSMRTASDILTFPSSFASP